MEIVLVALVLLVVFGLPTAALVMAILALRRTGRIIARIERLEEDASLRSAAIVAEPVAEPPSVTSRIEPPAGAATVTPSRAAREPFHWELFIGRQALGWIAVAALVFAGAFFLRYAIEQGWIGPLARVTLAGAAGVVLVIGGRHYDRRGWRRFSRMLTAGGLVLLYLISFAAFALYDLLPQPAAGLFLTVIVIQSALLALRYDSLSIALTAVIGGLLTPVLLRSEHDQYVSLFTYLAVLDLGVVLLLLVRRWPAIGTVALLGTQALFWSWYAENYHPEKLAWALGFQALIFLLFLCHNLGIQLQARRTVGLEDLCRLFLEAAFWFAAVYVLLRPDYRPWLGTAAVGMATFYALLARLLLAARPRETRQVLAALAVAVGFIGLTFPLQADAAWVSLGWAAEAAALWWFGVRVASPGLRAIAGALAALALGRLLAIDLDTGYRELFTPIFNSFALPALGAAAALLGGAAATRRRLGELPWWERRLAGAATVVSVLLLWLVLSIDTFDWFEARAALPGADRSEWLWRGQVSLSILWTVLASVALAIGFRFRQAWLRWVAIGLYGVTIAKVFLFDMAELNEFYRILAFMGLAIFLGLASWAYQQMKPGGPAQAEGEPRE